MPTADNIVVVYPQAGNAVFEVLARRLASVREEAERGVALRSASSVCGMDRGELVGEVVLVVQPAQCYIGLPDKDALSFRLSEARKRVAVIAECVGTIFFENQFKVPVGFDAMIDVGFVSQADRLVAFEIPYRFLFNGPTREERLAIETTVTSGRTVPWALVGHDRGDRVSLAHDLTCALDPGGAVFLPPSGVVIQKNKGMIAAEGLHELLRKTRYYVWKSLHEFNYYESFRFREALLAGAVPCKIDAWTGWESVDVPGIFSSADALAESIENDGYETLLEHAKGFYLSRGLLTDNLEEVLEGV